MTDNYTVVITTSEGQMTLGFDRFETVSKFLDMVYTHCEEKHALTVLISSKNRF